MGFLKVFLLMANGSHFTTLTPLWAAVRKLNTRTLEMLKLCDDLAFSRAAARLLLEVLISNLFISIHWMFDSTCLESQAGRRAVKVRYFSSLT